MLVRASFVVVAALLAQPALSFSNRLCGKGGYLDHNGNHQHCPDGQINAADYYSHQPTNCANCPAGTQSNSDHTQCVTCPSGQISSAGSQCQKCPAGQQDTNNHKSCTKCNPGYFNPTPGGTCSLCPAGTFNSVSGAKQCCQCCAGYYSVPNRKSCQKCGNDKPHCGSGSDSGNKCKKHQGSFPTPPSSCTMQADNVCPNPSGGPPTGSPIARRKRQECAKGFESCPSLNSSNSMECVDTQNDPESCGGCVGLGGTDCTAIDGTSVSRCVKGSCVVDSCRKGWVKSTDGTSCQALNAQDTPKRRSSAKRAIRANML